MVRKRGISLDEIRKDALLYATTNGRRGVLVIGGSEENYLAIRETLPSHIPVLRQDGTHDSRKYYQINLKQTPLDVNTSHQAT